MSEYIVCESCGPARPCKHELAVEATEGAERCADEIAATESEQSDRTPHFDRRALTDDQRVLAEDIATAMPDRHDESCAVWSEDGDGCDCPLVMAIADGLHASRVVAIEVERGWDSATHRGERVVRMPFSPMPTEGSGQSDRIPRTDAARSDRSSDYNRGWADGNAAALDACNPIIESLQAKLAAPPEPTLTSEALRTLEHEVIRLCHPKDVGPIADLFARARRSKPWAASDRLPSVERVIRAAERVAATPAGNISGSKSSAGNRERLPERRAAYAELRAALASLQDKQEMT